MTSEATVVEQFFAAMQARDWKHASSYLADSLEMWWPVTDERYQGQGFLAMQQAYPEGWSIDVREVIAQGERVAARVAVDQAGERFWCHGWYRVAGGLITEGVELWATEGSEEPPAWRDVFTT